MIFKMLERPLPNPPAAGIGIPHATTATSAIAKPIPTKVRAF